MPLKSYRNAPFAGELDQRQASRLYLESHVRPRLSAIRHNGRKCFVIGVSGSAGLGKTAFCLELIRTIKESGVSAQHVPLDGYLLARDVRLKRRICGYEPQGWMLQELAGDVGGLIEKREPISFPSYDHRSGTHGEPLRAEPSEVIILDGNACVYEPIKGLLTSFLFFDSDNATMEQLRYETDTAQRGYSDDSARAVWKREIAPYDSWIAPHRNSADVVLRVNPDRKLTAQISPLSKITAFLSHCGEDTAVAETLCTLLENQGALVWTYTRTPMGGDRVEHTRSALNASNVVVLLMTHKACEDFWIGTEFGAAWILSKPIFVVRVGIQHHELPDELRRYASRSIEQAASELIRTLEKTAELPDLSESALYLDCEELAREAASKLSPLRLDPQIVSNIAGALSLDRRERQRAHNDLRRLPPHLRRSVLGAMHHLCEYHHDHVRAEALYCLGTIPADDRGNYYENEAFFRSRLSEGSTLERINAAKALRNYVPLPNETRSLLEDVKASMREERLVRAVWDAIDADDLARARIPN